MAVSRSPFSKKKTGQQDQDEYSKYISGIYSGDITRLSKPSKTTKNPSLSELRGEDEGPYIRPSERGGESLELNRANASAIRRVALSNLGEDQKQEIINNIQSITTKGQAPKSNQGLWGFLKNAAVKVVGGPLAGFGEQYNQIVGPIQRAVQSTAVELSDSLVDPFSKNPKYRFSVSDWWRQYNDENWGIYKGSSQYKTGTKWLDSGLQLSADIATDPTTYAGVGPSAYVGRAGRTALAARLGTKEMLERFPQLADKLDDVVRYGEVAVPKDVRAALGIETGLRFGGKVVPGTEAVATAWRATGGEARARLGDTLWKNAPDYALGLTPKSQRLIASQYLGRGLGKGADVAVPALAHWTATKYAKGAVAQAYLQSTREAKEIVEQTKTLRGIGDRHADYIYRLVEDPAAYKLASPEARAVADNYKDWQNALRNKVNGYYQKIAADYGVDVNEIGFVDDYIHHRITPEAKQFWSSGQMQSRGWFQGADVSAIDLTETGAPMMWRKLRAGEEFMGVPLQSGSIDEINKISQSKIGAPWFETDLATIADGYAYSLSKAIGRTAYVRRAFDYGSDVIRPMIPEIVPDKDLTLKLQRSYDTLLKSQRQLQNRVFGSVTGVKDAGQKSAKLARDVINGNLKKSAKAEKAVTDMIALIDKTVNDLEDARNLATTKTAQMRGEFGAVHQNLVQELTNLRAALAAGDGEIYAATQQLRQIYASIYPNHNPRTLEGKSADWLAEKILHAKGEPAAREVRRINQRIAEVRQELEQLPTTAENVALREAKLNELADLEETSFAFGVLADTRMQATYSDNGFMWGDTSDLVELPEEAVGFKIFNTTPTDEGARTAPGSIVTRAIPDEALVDLRNPEDFVSTFDSDLIPGSIYDSLFQTGLVDEADLFRTNLQAYVRDGKFDDLFLDAYPEIASLIQTVVALRRVKPDEIIGEELITGSFNDIGESLLGVVAARSVPESDMVANQMMDSLYRSIVSQSQPREGVLLPMNLIYATDEFPGQWSILTRSDWTPPPMGVGKTSETQLVQDNQFVNRIMDGFYEQDSLDVANRMADATEEIVRLEGQAVGIDDLNKELKSLTAQKGGYKSAATKRLVAAQKAKERLAAGQSIELKINGKTVRMTREKAQEQLVRLDRQYAAAEAKLEKQIDAVHKALGIPRAEAKLASYQERLPMMMNEAAVLRGWNETVGAQLKAEVDELVTLLKNSPARGAAAAQSYAWVRKVERAMNTTVDFLDDYDRNAYERVVGLLHADEARLAALDDEVNEAAINLAMSRKGEFGKLIKTTEDGWQAIAGLGVQIPDELINTWKPNLAKLQKQAEANKFIKAYEWYNRFFKTYATLTGGFLVRNAMSATFMNYVRGTSTENIIDGVKTAFKIMKDPNNWLDTVPATERALYEQAWRATEATGRGLADELAIPVTRASRSERIINNAVTRKFARANEHTERAVRLPVALDVLRKGGSYDDAVAAISYYHFDYSDLSAFDEKVKKVIPFWIWTSRNVPLQAVQQWTRPSVYATYDKIRESSPVDDDIMMPKWLADYNPIGFGAGAVLAPDLPMNRMAMQLESFYNPSRIVGNFNPIPKLGIELLADRPLGIDTGPFKEKKQEAKGKDAVLGGLLQILTGDNLASRDENGNVVVDERVPYVLNALAPTLGTLDRLTGGATGGKPTYNERWLSNVLNTVAGIPYRNIGEQQERGEAIRRQFAIRDYLTELVRQGVIDSAEQQRIMEDLYTSGAVSRPTRP